MLSKKKKQPNLSMQTLHVLLHTSISSTFGVVLQERIAAAPCLLWKPRVCQKPSPLTINSVPFAAATASLAAFSIDRSANDFTTSNKLLSYLEYLSSWIGLGKFIAPINFTNPACLIPHKCPPICDRTLISRRADAMIFGLASKNNQDEILYVSKMCKRL